MKRGWVQTLASVAVEHEGVNLTTRGPGTAGIETWRRRSTFRTNATTVGTYSSRLPDRLRIGLESLAHCFVPDVDISLPRNRDTAVPARATRPRPRIVGGVRPSDARTYGPTEDSFTGRGEFFFSLSLRLRSVGLELDSLFPSSPWV